MSKSGKMRVEAALRFTFKKGPNEEFQRNMERIPIDELVPDDEWDWKDTKAAIDSAVQELFGKRINMEEELDCIRMFCKGECMHELFSQIDDECFTGDEF